MWALRFIISLLIFLPVAQAQDNTSADVQDKTTPQKSDTSPSQQTSKQPSQGKEKNGGDTVGDKNRAARTTNKRSKEQNNSEVRKKDGKKKAAQKSSPEEKPLSQGKENNEGVTSDDKKPAAGKRNKRSKQQSSSQVVEKDGKELANKFGGKKDQVPKRIYAIFDIRHGKNDMGTFKVLLFHGLREKLVANFVQLAEGLKKYKTYNEDTQQPTGTSKEPFYDGLTFHRILEEEFIQGGDPLGDGTGGPGFQVDLNVSSPLRFQRHGLMAMANGSQFFITLQSNPNYSGKYPAIGRVIEGMDVVRKIGNIKTGRLNDKPTKPVVIKDVTIERVYTVN